MPDHFPQDDIGRFVSGNLAPRESRQMVRHLLEGCSECGRRLARATGLGLAERPPEGAYDSAVAKAIGRITGMTGSREEAVAMLSSLLSGQRSWRELSASEVATLRGLPQVGALIEAGRSLRHHDPQATLRFAKLARYAADRLSPKEIGAAAAADLRALAWAELGNAQRICDDLPRASRAMNRAIHWSGRGSRAPVLLARVADLLASLLAGQRRFGEGRQLLAFVFRIHSEEGRSHLAGRALISAGNLAAWEGDPGAAIQLMRRGLDLLDPRRDDELVAQTLRSMISLLADLGRFRAARRLLWRIRHLVVEQGNALELLRLRWLEGRIYAGLSDPGRAERAFQETRAGFAAKGQAYNAALAGLDLAALWARESRVREIFALAEEMIATFRALRIAREAIAALVILKRACASGESELQDLIELVGSFLEELERQPARRYDRSSSSPPGALLPSP